MTQNAAKTDDTDETDVGKWTALALILGFNELAKAAKTLGEKVFFRMARDAAERDYAIRGGALTKIAQDGDDVILVLKKSMPQVTFESRDVDLMRATIAAYDARASESAQILARAQEEPE